MKISFENVLGIHPQALQLRSQRLTVLANNIANADTPKFKARDIDFAGALAAADPARAQPVSHLVATHPRHLAPATANQLSQLKYRTPLMASLDGNTVDVHMEQTEFVQNGIQLQAAIRILDGKFRGMVNALRGE